MVRRQRAEQRNELEAVQARGQKGSLKGTGRPQQQRRENEEGVPLRIPLHNLLSSSGRTVKRPAMRRTTTPARGSA